MFAIKLRLFLNLHLSSIKFERIDSVAHVAMTISRDWQLSENISLYFDFLLSLLGKISVSTKMSHVILWVSTCEKLSV